MATPVDPDAVNACRASIERCVQLKSAGQWAPLRQEAAAAARSAAAIGREDYRARALFLLAQAHRFHGDTQGTIATYRDAIAAETTAGDKNLLSAAYDNLGNALADAGLLDEALAQYAHALQYEAHSEGRAAILNNKAMRLVELGMLRSAADTFEQQVRELERAGITGSKLAVALDNAATTIFGQGDAADALALLERTAGLFAPDDLRGRTINALSRSNVQAALGNKEAAAAAFREAHDFAFAIARNVDSEHYRQGFEASRAARLGPGDPAYRLFIEGIRAKDANAWAPGVERLRQASDRARKAGDHAFALRIEANSGALLADAAQVEPAIRILSSVRHEAGTRGLAVPESMAIGTLASLAAGGADIHESLGPLGMHARVAVLREVHARIVADAQLDPAEASFETMDAGANSAQLGKLAQEHYADDLAAAYYGRAVETARAVGAAFELANRLAGLRFVLARSGRVADAQAAATELASVLASGKLPERGQIIAHRALAEHTESDRDAAIEHLRAACAAVERLRQRIAPGPGRAEVLREYPWLFHRLAERLREAGEDAAAWAALQGGKARRLIDVLSAGSGSGAIPDTPPAVAEVAKLVGDLAGEEATLLVDLAIEQNGLTAYLVDCAAVRAVNVQGDLSQLAKGEEGDIRQREARLANLCLREPVLAQLAEAVTVAAPAGHRLLIVPDGFLHNFPLHITPVRGSPWCERAAIGYIPAAGVLRFGARGRRSAGRALVAGDSRADLPHAAAECAAVASALGTTPLLQQQCTRSAIEQALRAGELDVVHLAVHGRGDVRRGGRASLLLADGAGGTQWVALDALTQQRWHVELVVFSGCSTGVAGRRQGHELVGTARAALEAGARTVVACLWPVADEATAVLMEAFYAALVREQKVGPVDLRPVLDEARAALRSWLDASAPYAGAPRRDGREVPPEEEAAEAPMADLPADHVLTWGPFMLLGQPVVQL
ncbi:MAG TPA: CHAT domain-containing protein [Casimicrobiaceae bacterium]|jgi:tetratricopeptide (TPR) repeat protein|nr:CHAT domain-containing protein [Casimicrobiaceae bacterium]